MQWVGSGHETACVCVLYACMHVYMFVCVFVRVNCMYVHLRAHMFGVVVPTENYAQSQSIPYPVMVGITPVLITQLYPKDARIHMYRKS